VNVGDLVKIAPHCVNKGRLALVVSVVGDWGEVRIVYIDSGPHTNTSDGRGHAALTRNLRLVSEFP
jgi:hypothetical protein